MKKKVIASTLSLSLVLGSMAGLPLSNKGILEKLGAGTAQAATPGLDTITNELNNIHSFLWTDEEKADIRQVRDNLKALGNDTSNADLVSEIADKIRDKKNSSTGNYDRLTQQDVLTLFSNLGLYFDASGDELVDLLADANVRPILAQLAQLGGSSMDELTIQDAADFALAVNSAITQRISSKSLPELAILALDQQAMKDEIKAAIETVMGGTNKFSLVFAEIGITADDVAAVTNKIMAAADPDRSGTTMAALALLRSKVTFASTNEYGANSQRQNYTVSILGKTLPDVLTLKSSNANIGVKYESGKIVATTALTGTVTTEVTGEILAPGTYLNGKLLFKQPVTLTYTSSKNNKPSGGGGGGGGGVSTGSTDSPLKDVSKDIQDASGEKKDALLEKAKSLAEEAISKAATLDFTKNVTVDGDKATAKLDVASVLKQIQTVSSEIAKLKEELKSLDPNAPQPKAEMTLDFGVLSAQQFQAPLAKEILDAARESGITSLNLKLGGLSVAIDPKALGADTTLNVQKKDDTEATQVTKLPVASNVYEISLNSSNGEEVSSSTKSVELRLPVINASQYDAEKLVLVKIIDGKLQVFGGKYSAKDNQLKAKRNSFSTYTVIENNVKFNDIDSVQDWAGRQIEVAAAKGILEGRAEGEFVPNGSITRAEFAKLIVSTFGLEDTSATESFDDVNDSDWYKPYVAAAVKTGLVNGRTDKEFDPNGNITRAEMATIASRALAAVNQVKPVSDVDGALKVFADEESIHASLRAGVALSVAQRIIIGDEGGKFNPNAESTRAQAAVIIYRLLNK